MIEVRRRLAEPNASLAGFTLVVSLATSKISIAPFSEEGALSGPFSRWDLISIVEEQGERNRCNEEGHESGWEAGAVGSHITSVYLEIRSRRRSSQAAT